MSLMNTLGIGASGMGASATSLAVIGDNIANMGSTGFKAGRAMFGDMIPSIHGGLIGPSVMGMGTRLNTVQTLMNQGTLSDTNSALDVAVVGTGFFQVRDDANFLRHTLAYHTPDGPRMDWHPVTFTRYAPVERKY
jgi:flagellar hook protein FlgE